MRASKECCYAEGIVRLTNDFCSKHCLDTLFPRIRLMTPLFKLNYSNAQGGLALTGHLGVLLASSWGLSITWNTAWLLPMLIVQGVVWVSFFACLHETVHRTAFQSRKWNDRIATLCGFALFAFSLAHSAGLVLPVPNAWNIDLGEGDADELVPLLSDELTRGHVPLQILADASTDDLLEAIEVVLDVQDHGDLLGCGFLGLATGEDAGHEVQDV